MKMLKTAGNQYVRVSSIIWVNLSAGGIVFLRLAGAEVGWTVEPKPGETGEQCLARILEEIEAAGSPPTSFTFDITQGPAQKDAMPLAVTAFACAALAFTLVTLGSYFMLRG